jgi:hypothetical protein
MPSGGNYDPFKDHAQELLSYLLNTENMHLVNAKRHRIEGAIPYRKAKAVIDPSLSQGIVPKPGFEQAAEYTDKLYQLVSLLTGHRDISIQTFSEVPLASSGVIIVDEDNRTLLVYKNQPHIGKGKQEEKWGKAGTFILPHQRLSIRDYASAAVFKQIGWNIPQGYLRGFGPDIVVTKKDYDMTYRNHCYGLIHVYVVQVTAEEKAKIKACAKKNGAKICWKSHHSMQEMKAKNRLTLDDEWPYIDSMYKLDFKLWRKNTKKRGKPQLVGTDGGSWEEYF